MKILLATDGSESAMAALDFLMNFPFPAGSEALLFSVVDWSDYSMDGETGAMQAAVFEETRDEITRGAQQRLAGERDRLEAAGWRVSTEIRHGEPADEIILAAERPGVDLVMLGSHGTSGVRRFLLGSVSGRVLEYAPCSVLVVRGQDRKKATSLPAPDAGWRILLACDISRSSRKALDLCASLPLGERAVVTAVSVMPMVTAFRQDIRQHLNSIWQQKKQAVQVALDDAVAVLHRCTPHAHAELREGADVSEEILDYAQRTGADLIMIGSKGTGAIRRFLLGSITGRVARHAHCSVWVVRNDP